MVNQFLFLNLVSVMAGVAAFVPCGLPQSPMSVMIQYIVFLFIAFVVIDKNPPLTEKAKGGSESSK